MLRNVLLRSSYPQCRINSRGILTVSYTEGPNKPLLCPFTLPQYYAETLLPAFAKRPALISRHEHPRAHGGPISLNMMSYSCLSWDFSMLDSHVLALSAGLKTLGVTKGSRVGVTMGNCSAYAMLQWACARIGAILVTINPAYRIHEIIASLHLTGVSHLFVVPQLRSSMYLSLLADSIPSLRGSLGGGSEMWTDQLPRLRHIIAVNNMDSQTAFQRELGTIPSAVDFRDILVWQSTTSLDEYHDLHKDDVINIQFTSGTTGYPKGVSLTHSNLLNNALSIGGCMHLSPKDKICNVPPLFHCFGLVLGNLAAWVYGAAIVYSSENYDASAILDALHDEQCTGLHGVPTHFIGVLAEYTRRKEIGHTVDLSRLRTGIAAGSSIPINLMTRLIEELNMKDLTIAYGMTETSPVSFQTTTSDTLIQRVETVGKAAPHVTAKIVDPHADSLEPVPVGVPGELCVSGYLLHKGYWEDSERTDESMKIHPNYGPMKWMHTGDIGIMDEEGYLRIVGRIKDVIIRGGENLFPVQIENILSMHPGIRESAVIAVPDDKFGEIVGVWIVKEKPIGGKVPERGELAELTRRGIRQWVHGRMNPQNAPEWVWFVGEDGEHVELPKTASGKVQKHILREWGKSQVRKGLGRANF